MNEMNVNLLDKKLIGNNTILKVWKKVDSLAEARGMTRQEFIEWSKAEHNRSNISEYEYNLIFAYQVSKVIERLKINNKDMLIEAARRKYSWTDRFKSDFSRVDQAVKHLKDVCNYVKEKNGIGYEYEWLLDFDDVLFDRMLEGNNRRDKKEKLIRDD